MLITMDPPTGLNTPTAVVLDGGVFVPATVDFDPPNSAIADLDGAGGGLWAAGQLVWRWDGAGFVREDVPVTNGQFSSIDAAAPSDVWVVGSTRRGAPHPRIVRWNGTKWLKGSLAGLPAEGDLEDVSIVGPRNVWAIGTTPAPHRPFPKPFLAQWDGHRWELVNVPWPGEHRVASAIHASAHDVWIVGARVVSVEPPNARMMILHHHGSAWSVERFPARDNTTLDGIDVVNGQLWATGWTRSVVDSPPGSGILVRSC
jgi:hypothetical protein